MLEQTLRKGIAQAILLSSASLPLASASEPSAGAEISAKPAASAANTREGVSQQPVRGNAWESHSEEYGIIRGSQSVLERIHSKIADTSEDAIYIKKAIATIEKALAADQPDAVLPLQRTIQKNLELFAESEDGKIFRVEPILKDMTEAINSAFSPKQPGASNAAEESKRDNNAPEEIPPQVIDVDPEFVSPPSGNEGPGFNNDPEEIDLDDYSKRFRYHFNDRGPLQFRPPDAVQQLVQQWKQNLQNVRSFPPEFKNGMTPDYRMRFFHLPARDQVAIYANWNHARKTIRQLPPEVRNSVPKENWPQIDDLILHYDVTPELVTEEIARIIREAQQR